MENRILANDSRDAKRMAKAAFRVYVTRFIDEFGRTDYHEFWSKYGQIIENIHNYFEAIERYDETKLVEVSYGDLHETAKDVYSGSNKELKDIGNGLEWVDSKFYFYDVDTFEIGFFNEIPTKAFANYISVYFALLGIERSLFEMFSGETTLFQKYFVEIGYKEFRKYKDNPQTYTFEKEVGFTKDDSLTQKIKTKESMTAKKLKEKVHFFIGKAKTKEAMDAIAIWAHENSQKQLKDDINLLKGELVTLDRQETLGLLSFSDVAREKAKLNHRLLNLLNGIDKTNDKVEEGTEETVPKKVTKKKAVAKPTAKKILFLGANPFDTGKLNLKEEYAGIAKQLEDKGAKERLVLKSEFCTDLEGFQEKTNTFRPNILHFAGHGSDANGELEAFGRGIGRPDWKENIGLIFHKSGYGGAMLINDATLDYNFQTFIEDDKIPIEVLVLNACYSTNQAEVLSKRVKYVVGVHNSIDDNASIDFSAGFYYGLSDGKTIESAFRYGKGRAMPKLKDKNQIVLFIEGVISNL